MAARLGERSLLLRALQEKLADRTGFEPATSGVTGRHSNQLNYRSETLLFAILVGGTGIEPVTLAL